MKNKPEINFVTEGNIDKWTEKAPAFKKSVQYKHYLRLPSVPIPATIRKNKAVEIVLKKRRSARGFKGRGISLENISRLLICGAGINVKTKEGEFLRTYPSAGARYPLEVYLISLNNKNGIKKGVYHFNVKHSLLETVSKDADKKYISGIFEQKIAEKASLLFVITAVPQRTLEKYGKRGWRYVLFEAGHLAQNIYLLAEENRLKCCAIGAFLDKDLGKVLHLREEFEFPLYVLSLD